MINERKKVRLPLTGFAALLVVLVLILTACHREANIPGDCSTPLSAGNEAAERLRAALAAQGSDTIVLNEEIVISGETLVINGKKTLTGSGCLTADGLTGDYILEVAENAALLLDGVTIDGAGTAKSGILVSKDANLFLAKGELKNVSRLGVRVEGEAQVRGRITEAGTSWVDLRAGGSLVLDGAELTTSGGVGIQTMADSEITVQGNTVLSGSKGNLLYNSGTALVEDAVLSDAVMYLVANNGKMTLRNTDISRAATQGLLYNYDGAELLMEDCALHESQNYLFSNSGTATVKDVEFSDSASYAIYNEGGKADLTVTDASVENIRATAFFNRLNSTMTLKNISVKDVSGYGLFNRGGTMTVQNITVA